MKKFLLIMTCAVMSAAAYAQSTNSTLTIFSEDGYKFYLILNGQRMNDKPETNIRLQNLTQQYYNCKIIFDDKTINEVSKTYLPVVDLNNPTVSQDVCYKLKSNKDGKQVLRLFSAQPSEVTATPVIPQDVVVYNYGTTVPVTTTTTVTETTTTQGTGMNTNMNVNGMNVNVQVSDPNIVQQTTTTTTYSTTTTNQTPPPPPPAPAGPCAYAMSPGDYNSAKESIAKASFEETKLKSAKSIVSNNCLFADQIASICRLFDFENTKLDFAKFAYSHCYDKNNYFKINDVFDFDSSRDQLSAFTAK